MNYTLPTQVNIDGIDYNIRSDWRVALEIIEVLNDADLKYAEKAEAVLIMFYEDMPTNIAEALKKCFEFLDMGETQKKKSPRLIDWEKDFKYIVAPVNRVLGYEVRSVQYLHWWTFLSAYMEIGGDCVLSQIVSMRDKLARGTKLEKHEREWLRKNGDIVHLKTQMTSTEDDIISQWTVKNEKR